MVPATVATPTASPGIDAAERPRAEQGALAWASLVPLFLLLHPYQGLVQDARIYVGRGVADRDPDGVGRDIMFAHDGQTTFSVMRWLVDAMLQLVGPGTASMALALLGGMASLLGAVALSRSLAGGRVAWSAVVCMIVLPTAYGAYGIFSTVETVATPRAFAQAAVLGGLAAMTAGRRGPGAALLGSAFAFHPLMALPGVAIVGLMLAVEDRRWLLPVAAAGVAVLAAALLGLPPADRLIQPMDAVWLSIMRGRSAYLFPSLWPMQTFGPIIGQAAAAAAAAALAPPRVRALLSATVAVAACGLAGSWVFGDLHASTLVVQVQLWRWLWPLAALGHASLALAAVALWRHGATARLALATLVMGNLMSAVPPVAALLSVVALGLVAAHMRGVVLPRARLLVPCMSLAAVVWGLADVAGSACALVEVLRSASNEGGAVDWPKVVGLGVQSVPLAAGAVALAILPPQGVGRETRFAAAAALLCACAAAAWLWDGRSAERRFVDEAAGDAALRALVGSGPGEVLWIDEDSESWFLLGRPAFLNEAQAGPMLFSRDLAVEWADRVGLLLRLGLMRPENAQPWRVVHRSGQDLVPTADAVARFCADPRRPAAVVAPGDQRGAVPPGSDGGLWRPPTPFIGLVVDGDAVHWRRTALFTVIRCRG